MNPFLYRPPTQEEIELKSYRPPPAPDGGPHFVFDGNVLTLSQFKHFLSVVHEPVIVAGTAVMEPNLVQLFDSRDAFEDWGSHTYLANAFEEINRIIYTYRHPEDEISGDFGVGLIANTPVGHNLSIATVRSESKRVSRATLFEGKNFTGRRQVSMGASVIGNLGDFNFAETASSVKAEGMLMLADDINFGGYRFYIIGESEIDVPDLARWGFDKAARSAVLL